MKNFRKRVTNVRVLIGVQDAAQHRLVVGDFKIPTHSHLKKSSFFVRFGN